MCMSVLCMYNLVCEYNHILQRNTWTLTCMYVQCIVMCNSIINFMTYIIHVTCHSTYTYKYNDVLCVYNYKKSMYVQTSSVMSVLINNLPNCTNDTFLSFFVAINLISVSSCGYFSSIASEAGLNGRFWQIYLFGGEAQKLDSHGQSTSNSTAYKVKYFKVCMSQLGNCYTISLETNQGK